LIFVIFWLGGIVLGLVIVGWGEAKSVGSAFVQEESCSARRMRNCAKNSPSSVFSVISII
jgi:hypothetical protein